jgi:hypothetical protein
VPRNRDVMRALSGDRQTHVASSAWNASSSSSVS